MVSETKQTGECSVVEAIRRVPRRDHLYLCTCITEIQRKGAGSESVEVSHDL